MAKDGRTEARKEKSDDVCVCRGRGREKTERRREYGKCQGRVNSQVINDQMVKKARKYSTSTVEGENRSRGRVGGREGEEEGGREGGGKRGWWQEEMGGKETPPPQPPPLLPQGLRKVRGI
ncbi:hypothetical protein BO86DRAFT_194968 [Aspergillus japonicus CBS 114.51]|uniref:Uncharacterized protein n=1 Tax=Aspergillus japonicus CBS 114.51 TaxID=1448312 RepID=A0A8T8WQW5_ASPJA|nr:hypothetical protein BO86DRAFT_194968 [Aspergillus japonicus CBS 114.51]RAH78171.1 hypothetical protein BO86DRAFT_194968 [Aspergillus japonicus CBS 114.51]